MRNASSAVAQTVGLGYYGDSLFVLRSYYGDSLFILHRPKPPFWSGLSSADQLRQQNCWGFLAEPCENTTLTRRGRGSSSPRREPAPAKAGGARKSFGSSTMKPLPPGACPGGGRGLPSSCRSGRSVITPYARGQDIGRRSGRRSAAGCPPLPIALRACDRRGPCGSAADWLSRPHARW